MAKKVGSVYAEIRAKVDKLEKDMAKAHGVAVSGTKKMQQSYDRLNFNKATTNLIAFAKQLAVAYGSFMVLGRVLESAKIGAALDKQSKSFENLSMASKTTSKEMVANLRESSQGLVSESDLIAAAGKAMLMNIPAKEIIELMNIAAATSRMTGQEVTAAFADITMGVARQSRMILDNLGIIVSVEKANDNYAKALGKTASSLTDVEKRQAFMNEVLKSGRDMIERLGSQSGALDGVNKLVAAQSDLWAEVNKTVATFLDKELSEYSRVLNWIAAKLKSMRSDSVTTGKKAAWEEIEMLKSLEAKGMAQPGAAAKKESEYNKKYLTPQLNLKPSEEFKKQGSFQSIKFNMANWRLQEGIYANNTDEQNKILLKERDEYLKKIADTAREAQEESKKFAEEIKKLSDEFEESKIFGGDDSNFERMEAMLRSGSMISQMEAERMQATSEALNAAFDKENERLVERVKAYEDANRDIIDAEKRQQEILKDTANIMSQNFSDAFASFVMGAKSAKEAFQDMAQSIISAMVRMASQRMFEQVFSLMMGSIGGGGGASLAINQPGFPGAATFHAGGIVGSAGSGGSRSIPASAFSFAPRLHNGLMPDEFPAVLQKGESVIPKGGGGGVVNNYYQISAMDVRSFAEYLRRSGAVPAIVSEDMRGNGMTRRTMKSKW